MKLPGHATQSLEPATATMRFLQAITDPEGKLLFNNKTFAAFFSTRARDQHFSSLVDTSSLADYTASIEQCIRTGVVTQLRLEHTIGERSLWIGWEIEVISNETGGGPKLQWIGQLEDPCQSNSAKHDPAQALASEQLRQSELFFRALIADSLDGILLVDIEGTISFSSESVVNILGYQPEDLIGANCFLFVHPDDREIGFTTFQEEVRRAPQKKFIDVRLLKKSGEWLWCMVRGHNLMNNPAVGKMLIYFCDDTYRRNMEAALIESRERFHLLIQNLNLGVILCDAAGTILLCNPSSAHILNVEREDELTGRNLFNPEFKVSYADGRTMAAEDYPVIRAIREKKVIRDEIIGVAKLDGEGISWLQVNAQPVLESDQSVKHVICSFLDITEERHLADQLKQQELQKQKLLLQATIDGQEKERSEISRELHDNISQHLTITRLYLEVAKDKSEGQELEMISQAYKGLLYISKEIRRISQSLAPPELRHIGLVESIRDLCDVLRSLHTFTVEFEYDTFCEKAMPDRMKLMLFRIIQEQVNNTIRHAAANHLHISLASVPGETKLSISDDGRGYDPHLIKKGLGLTNIINRVELFDGHVDIVTAPGKGCILNVTVPHPSGPCPTAIGQT